MDRPIRTRPRNRDRKTPKVPKMLRANLNARGQKALLAEHGLGRVESRRVMRTAERWRPLTRGECRCQQRPCPWVACRYHLFGDWMGTGSVRIHDVMTPVWEMRETCSLDVADRGGQTLSTIAELFGVSRERIRQIEEAALAKLAAVLGDRRDPPDPLPPGPLVRGDEWACSEPEGPASECRRIDPRSPEGRRIAAELGVL